MSTAIQFEDITKEYEGKTIIEKLWKDNDT